MPRKFWRSETGEVESDWLMRPDAIISGKEPARVIWTGPGKWHVTTVQGGHGQRISNTGVRTVRSIDVVVLPTISVRSGEWP